MVILGDDEEGWWRGKVNGKEGVFPCNFVEPIEEEEEEPPPYSNMSVGKPGKLTVSNYTQFTTYSRKSSTTFNDSYAWFRRNKSS